LARPASTRPRSSPRAGRKALDHLRTLFENAVRRIGVTRTEDVVRVAVGVDLLVQEL
jgi:uncharacterized protein YjeT (DUF2065 family)